MPLKKKSTLRAFTIAELLVVVAIILVVATMTIPAIAPLMRGRHLRSSAAILQAALMNARQYAVNTQTNQPCLFFQWTNMSDLGAATENYSYVQTYSNSTYAPSELSQYIQIFPKKYESNSLTYLANANNQYTLVSFKPDGSTTLNAAMRLYLIDLRTVLSESGGPAAAETNWSRPVLEQFYDEDWNDLIIEVNHITGRIRVLDPDQLP